jgi:creatinine amidohydrolase
MTPSVLWAELTAAELREAASADSVVILPVAALEQHGPHLPTMVDTRLCSACAKQGAELAAAQGTRAVVLPCVWTGMSDHHLPFGGTVSLPFDAFRAVLLGIARSVRASGFRKLFILNGHGGNIFALPTIIHEAASIEGLRVAGGTYWFLAEDAIGKILEDQTGVRHACEAETSAMMAVEPGLVRQDRLAGAFGADPPRVQGGMSDPVFVWRDFAERSTSGVIGDARRATPEKGERLLAATAGALAAAIADPKIWARQTP